MTHEIYTLLLPIGKYILASTLLVLFYLLFYRGKTTYDLSRKFLVSIAMVALLLSQFQIAVKKPPVQVIRVQASLVPPTPRFLPLNAVKTPQSFATFPQGKVSEKAQTTTFLNTNLTKTLTNENQRITPLKTKIISWFTLPHLLLLMYGTVSLILIVSFIFQYFKIISMKRKGVVRQWNGFEIVESADIPTPFSFCKTIFIGSNLSGKKLDVVIKHEQWHIRHHHYVDVMVMETLVRLLWFNPLLWWIRKELRNISEFQADRSVLDEGHELYQYQTIILEEVMEQNPYLANGFNNSFTKKRFIMMKNNIQGRFTILRRAALLPFMVSVFCLLSFTQGKGEIRYVQDEPVIQNSADSNSMGAILEKNRNNPNMECKIDDAANPNNQDVDQALDKASTDLGLAIDELNLTIQAKNKQTRVQSLRKVFAYLNIQFNRNEVGQTQINESLFESISNQELIQSRNHFIELKKEMDVLKKEQSKSVKAQKFSLIAMNMFQDPLVSKVFESQMAGVSDMLKNMMEPMMNAMGNMTKSMADGISKKVEVANPTPETNSSALASKSKNEQESVMENDRALIESGYLLKSNQVKILDLPMDHARPLRIYLNQKETKVVLAIPNTVNWDLCWFRIDSDFKIIDRQTMDTYYIRKVANGIPLGTIINSFCVAGRMMEITLIFPPLKKDVSEFDLVEDYSKDAVLPSQYQSRTPIDFRKLWVRDYLVSSGVGSEVIR